MKRGLAIASVAIALAGCAAEGDSGTSLTVAAAASLEGAFGQLLAEFADEHPDIDVLPLIVDGSATLATQLREGAPFDVVALADEQTMWSLDSLVGAPELIATNTVALAVAPGNPLGIASLADLAGARLVMCAPAVPCGAAARAVLERASVGVAPVSEEQSVTAVLTKVRSGDADAGLVYATDVLAAQATVSSVEIAGADAVINRYPIARVEQSPNTDAARAFIDFATSERGAAVLAAYGFGSP